MRRSKAVGLRITDAAILEYQVGERGGASGSGARALLPQMPKNISTLSLSTVRCYHWRHLIAESSHHAQTTTSVNDNNAIRYPNIYHSRASIDIM